MDGFTQKVLVHRPGRTNAAATPTPDRPVLAIGDYTGLQDFAHNREENTADFHAIRPCNFRHATYGEQEFLFTWAQQYSAHVIMDEHWVKTQTYMDGLIPRITIQGASHIAKFVYKLGSMFDDIYIYTFNYILCRWCFDPTDIHEHKLRVPSCSPQGLKLGGFRSFTLSPGTVRYSGGKFRGGTKSRQSLDFIANMISTIFFSDNYSIHRLLE